MESHNLLEDLRIEGWNKRSSSWPSTRGSFNTEKSAYDSGRYLTGRQPIDSNAEGLHLLGKVKIEPYNTRSRDDPNVRGCLDSRNCTRIGESGMISRCWVESSAEGVKSLENIRVRPCDIRLRGFSSVTEEMELKNCTYDSGGDRIGRHSIKTSAESPNLFKDLRVRGQNICSQEYLNDGRCVDLENHVSDDRGGKGFQRVESSAENVGVFNNVNKRCNSTRLRGFGNVRGRTDPRDDIRDDGRNVSKGHALDETNSSSLDRDNLFNNAPLRKSYSKMCLSTHGCLIWPERGVDSCQLSSFCSFVVGPSVSKKERILVKLTDTAVTFGGPNLTRESRDPFIAVDNEPRAILLLQHVRGRWLRVDFCKGAASRPTG